MAEIDLHCHSTISDGLLPPAEVVARAASRGVKVLALTDHDDVRGLAEATLAANTAGIKLINGVEISVNWGKQTLHIVGLNIDPTNAILLAGLESIRSGRVARAKLMSQDLARVGIAGVFEGALPYAANPEMIGRAHIARYLVEKGICKNMQAVFRRYLTPGKPGYVAHEWTNLAHSIDWIHAAGGLAILAHPGRYDVGKKQLRMLIGEFRDLGGDALEVATANHTPVQIAQFALLAAEFGLMASAGSDFHGAGHYGDIGAVPPLPETCRPVWHQFAPTADALQTQSPLELNTTRTTTAL